MDKGGDLIPAEEAIAITVAEEPKPRQKRKRTKKSKVGKSEVCEFQSEKTLLAADWGKPNPSNSDWGVSKSSTCDSTRATPVHSHGATTRETIRPTWGVMKDYRDDDRADKEWGEWGKDAERQSRDEKMRGESPPPTGKRGSSDRMCVGGPWEGASAGSATGWGSPTPPLPLDSGVFHPVGLESSSKSPEESPKEKNPGIGLGEMFFMSSASPSVETPKSSSEKEESTFLVRVKKGETKAKVLFLNSQKSFF